jgi:hypothetical protein
LIVYFEDGQLSIYRQVYGQCQGYSGGEVKKLVGGARKGIPVNIACEYHMLKYIIT